MKCNKTLIFTSLYTLYVLAFWLEFSFLNIYTKETDDFFGMMKMISIIQLPFPIAAWFYYFDNYKSIKLYFRKQPGSNTE